MFLQLGQSTVHIGRQPSGFTESFYTEWDDGLGTDQISIFMVLRVESTQVPSGEIAKEAFQLLKDHFLHDLAGDPYDRFELALREVNEMVESHQKNLELKFIPNVHVVLGVIQGDKLYLSQHGQANGYLIRKRHLSLVTDDLFDAKNTEDLFQNIASGSLEPGDSLVFATDSLINYATPNDLAQLYTENSVDKANQKLSDLLTPDVDDVLTVLSLEVLERVEESEGRHYKEEVSQEEPRDSIAKASAFAAHREKMEANLRKLHRYVEGHSLWTRLTNLSFMQKLSASGNLKDRRSLLMGVIGTSLVLILGVGFLIYSGTQERQTAALQEKLATAESYVEQATTRGTFDKTEASDLLAQAETLALEVLDSGKLGGQSSALLDDIREKRDSLDNIVAVQDSLLELADLSSVTEPIQNVLAYDDAHLLVTDHSVIPVLINEVKSPILVDAVNRIVASTYFADIDAVVLLLENGQIAEYQDGNVQLADTSDSSWKTGSGLATYSNKLYILDPANGQIWRYQRGSAAYTGAQAYIDPEKVDLKSAVSMAIDGKVWILNAQSEVVQLLSGAPVEFKILKAPLSSMEGSNMIYTELEVPALYVLNPEARRLYVFDKSTQNANISYRLQYDLASLKGDIKGFYLDKSRNVIVISTSTKLYELSFE